MDQNLENIPASLALNIGIEKWYEEVVYSVAEEIESERRKQLDVKAGKDSFPPNP